MSLDQLIAELEKCNTPEDVAMYWYGKTRELLDTIASLRAALETIADRPGPGTDNWGNAVNENDYMADIAKDALEGKRHWEVTNFLAKQEPTT